MPANRTYKDSVFSLFLGEPERLIEVYNAVEGTNYPADTPVQINTLEDVLWRDQINDLSFVLDGQMVILIEHQSTVNENMALRMLLYGARVYEKMLAANAVYRRKRIPLPTPRFIVLYNGPEDFPEHGVQTLSQSFMVPEKQPSLELKVDLYNINYNKSSQLIQKSRSLMEYSLFVHQVNMELASGVAFSQAVTNAIRYCIAHDVMREFLSQNGSEVENMLFTEWNMEEALAVTAEEARAEGMAEGLVEGMARGMAQGKSDGLAEGITRGKAEGKAEERKKVICALDGVLSPEVIAERLNVPLAEVLAVLEKAKR